MAGTAAAFCNSEAACSVWSAFHLTYSGIATICLLLTLILHLRKHKLSLRHILGRRQKIMIVHRDRSRAYLHGVSRTSSVCCHYSNEPVYGKACCGLLKLRFGEVATPRLEINQFILCSRCLR
jgi:hypothetical protein